MTDIFAPSENRDYFEVEQHITASSRYYAGRVGSRFFIALRDEQKILGSHCPKCNLTYWPPRNTCGRCFSQLSESDLLEIGPLGTLETFTRPNYTPPQPVPAAPVLYGIIKLDGADTGMAHLLGEVDFENLKIGMRMQPVFAEAPAANILAIRYFKPAEE
jgi:uncharacterized OB-fold protein